MPGNLLRFFSKDIVKKKICGEFKMGKYYIT